MNDKQNTVPVMEVNPAQPMSVERILLTGLPFDTRATVRWSNPQTLVGKVAAEGANAVVHWATFKGCDFLAAQASRLIFRNKEIGVPVASPERMRVAK